MPSNNLCSESELHSLLVRASNFPISKVDRTSLQTHMDTMSLILSTFDVISASGNDLHLNPKARTDTLRQILGKSASSRDELVAKITLIDGLLKNTHIRDLPVEIMAEIFAWRIFSSLKDSLYAVIRLIPLQRVCRRWHDVISSEPRVQNTIRLPLPPHLDSSLTEYPDSRQVSYWQAFNYTLYKTRNDVPLRILAGGTQTIDNSPESVHSFNNFLFYLYYLLPRTSHARLVFKGTQYVNLLPCRPLPVDIPLPQMRYLDWDCNLFPFDDVNTFFKNASGLQVLKLRTSLHLNVLIPTLKDFYFDDGMLSAFLPYMPALNYVECKCAYSVQLPTPVLHKRLQKMRVLGGTPFAGITLPALKDLYYSPSGSALRGFWPTSEDVAFFERSNCQLRRLAVTTPTLMAAFINVLSLQNNLHYLYLAGDSGAIAATYHAVVAYIRAGHHPCLKEVSFTGTRARTTNPFATWVPWEWCIEAAKEGMLHVDSEAQLWPQDTGVSQSDIDLLVRSMLRKA